MFSHAAPRRRNRPFGGRFMSWPMPLDGPLATTNHCAETFSSIPNLWTYFSRAIILTMPTTTTPDRAGALEPNGSQAAVRPDRLPTGESNEGGRRGISMVRGMDSRRYRDRGGWGTKSPWEDRREPGTMSHPVHPVRPRPEYAEPRTILAAISAGKISAPLGKRRSSPREGPQFAPS